MSVSLIRDRYTMSVKTKGTRMEYVFETKDQKFSQFFPIDVDIYDLEEFVYEIFSRLCLDMDICPEKTLLKYLKMRQDERS